MVGSGDAADVKPTLCDRTAIVTGAARGIGAAIAYKLLELGASVVLVDIDADEVSNTTAKLLEKGYPASFVVADVTDPTDISGLADRQRDAHGRLDILVNNAAILDSTALRDLSEKSLGKVQDVNQNAALWMIKAFQDLIIASEHGRIVNIASIIGVLGAGNSVAYASAKGGLISMTRALAVDLAANNILVNCICPGFVDTRMALLPDGSGHEYQTDWFNEVYIKHGRLPLRRPARPDEIAAATAFFCGDDCRYVTGQSMMVDGGISATF